MFKILICDDSPINTEILKQSLYFCYRKLDMKIVSRHSGKAGAKIAKEERFDLIITDLEMPEGDGLFLINKIRNSELNKWIPIFMWSTSIRNDKEQFALDNGANGWLEKPADLSEIERKLSEYLVQ